MIKIWKQDEISINITHKEYKICGQDKFSIKINTIKHTKDGGYELLFEKLYSA